MTNDLSNYTLDELAKRVEKGGDSPAQKAEPILIAKSLIELKNSMEKSSGVMSESAQVLREEFQRFSKSNNRHANAMKWLTAGIVFLGIIQIIITGYKLLNAG